jgi:GT2 family glycosyltransferase
MSPSPASLTGVVVHWQGEEELGGLLAAWPPGFPIVVVDNGSRDLATVLEPARERLGQALTLLAPHDNLGFAGGANLGLHAAETPWVLLLNPDACPRPGALDELLVGAAAYPEAVGIVPSLLSADGRSQHRWQLRPLPSPFALVLQCLLLPGVAGPRLAPAAGTEVAQPAAAALLLRRERVLAHGGFDAGFVPAWFEDVDLARRLADAGETFRYWPAAAVVHGLGSSVPRLGYGPFLAAYYRNLLRYMAKHHGRAWHRVARGALAGGMALRLALLPFRRPRRAASRMEAARGLLAVGWGALAGWSSPPT